MKSFLAIIFVGGTTIAAAPASASCRIHNDPGFDFTIESGNTSNQHVGPHTTT